MLSGKLIVHNREAFGQPGIMAILRTPMGRLALCSCDPAVMAYLRSLNGQTITVAALTAGTSTQPATADDTFDVPLPEV